jgi:hypothetical protein
LLRARDARAIRPCRRYARQNFDGDDSVQAGITGGVNFAHPASAHTREDFVRAETFARKDRHGLPLAWNRGDYSAMRSSRGCVISIGQTSLGHLHCSSRESSPQLQKKPFNALPADTPQLSANLGALTNRAGNAARALSNGTLRKAALCESRPESSLSRFISLLLGNAPRRLWHPRIFFVSG